MNELIARENFNAETLEKVLIQGDLSKLSSQERLFYYNRVCTSLGLNPLTKPFDYITLNGKLTLYAKRDCTDQLRKLHDISIKITSREKMDDLYIVTAQGINKDGRIDESTGAVSILNLRGEALANALMKSETKAKRRVTLSLAGLGWLDETEAETIPNAKLDVLPETTPIAEIVKSQSKPTQKPTKAIDVISVEQGWRLHTIGKKNESIIRAVMKKYGYNHTADIRTKDYDKICAEVESDVFAKEQQEAETVVLPWEEEKE